MDIALIHSTNPNRRLALNKDLNGGFGTADDYGPSVAGRILRRLKWKLIGLPVVSIAHAQAILKRQGHRVRYYEGALPEEPFDVGLVLGSIVDFRNERRMVRALQRAWPGAKVGVFGGFPQRFPEHYPEADFVIGGELEAFCLYDDVARLCSAAGRVATPPLNLDDLPAPDYSGFPIHKYAYAPMLPKKPFLTLQSSKGCPYPCGHYCSYGAFQGASHRQRSAGNVYDDMWRLRRDYGVRSIQFRDPLFGLSKDFVQELCSYLIERPLRVEWGMETRADLLNEKQLDLMQRAGLRSVNIGVETTDPDVAKANHRKLANAQHQHRIIEHAKRIGVKINAFYMFALETDTPAGLRRMTDFAVKANTTAARFCVSTPYPGTRFHDEMRRQGRLIEDDWERYTQFNLVHKQPQLSPGDVQKALINAYLRFYLRPAYMLRTAVHVWRSNSRLFADNRLHRVLPLPPRSSVELSPMLSACRQLVHLAVESAGNAEYRGTVTKNTAGVLAPVLPDGFDRDGMMSAYVACDATVSGHSDRNIQGVQAKASSSCAV